MSRMTAEMAEDMGLIPCISPYKKLGWMRDRYKTNEEYKAERKRLWAPFGYDEKSHTVEVREDEEA